jgi:hypothetical protein
MMMNRELKTFSSSEMIGVIVGFGVEEDGKSVGFSHF